MKRIKTYTFLSLALLVALGSCKKETISNEESGNSAVAAAGAIAVGTTATGTVSATKDSLYVVGCYNKRSKRDTVAFTSLPAGVSTYLTDNYAGYSFKKAYKITDPASQASQYIVVISYSSNPIGLRFTAAGVFVNVLEQRAGADLAGKGWHPGGPFGNRDGKRADSVAISALPAAVSSFFKTTYPTDTLLHAHRTPDSAAFVLISKNKLLYSTVVKATGTLVKRVELGTGPGKPVSVEKSALPAAVLTYLDTTYPAYVFNKAFSLSRGSTLQAYHVFITSNSTNYAVEFTATGTFVRVKAIK